MRFTVAVDSTVYGLFDTINEAEEWAERMLPGRNWKVCQYIKAYRL